MAALAATGALAGHGPSIAESTGPYPTDADIGPARLELTVTAALPERRIAAIHLHASKAGPGHYVVSGAALGVAGEWSVEVAARVSELDEYRARVDVPVR